jgi:hypothetical protein
MRWVKHLSLAHKDEQMDAILDLFGAEAYGVFWLLVEDIAAPMEPGKMAPAACHSAVVWASICRCSVRRWRSIVMRMAEKNLIVMQSSDDRVRIEIPNILKYKDEYTKRSVQTPEQEQKQKQIESRGRAEAEKTAATAPSAPIPIRPEIPEAEESRIRKLAAKAPDPQDFELGIQIAVQELVGSVNPESTLAAMEENIPLWWNAMRDGRAKTKTLRWLIRDRDYLRRPREPTKAPEIGALSRREQSMREEMMKD